MTRYVAFEGIDGAGKSTVAAAVADELEAAGERVVRVREPGGTPVGEKIREILLGGMEQSPWTEALLFAAARAELAAETIRPALADAAWVIGDRSVYSSLAYQGGGRGLGVDTVRQINESGLDGVWPDLVVLLETDPATAVGRQADPDRIGAESVEFQGVVAAAFSKLAADERERFLVIDATEHIADVVDAVVTYLRSMP